jgi:hypothetical protein
LFAGPDARLVSEDERDRYRRGDMLETELRGLLSRIGAHVVEVNSERDERVYDLSSRPESELDFERAERVREQRQADGVDAPSWLQDGVPASAEGFDGWKPRARYPDVMRAHRAVSAWLDASGPGMLSLASSPGNGKSRLAKAAAAQLKATGHDVVLREEPKLYAEIRAEMRPGRNADRYIRGICEAHWLIIDDVGTTALSDTMRSVQDQIFDARWAGAPLLRTLVTLNLGGSDLPARIASRLADKERSLVVEIEAPDYRVSRK